MTPFLGQLMTFSFPFAPKGWAFCNGQLLPIAQNQALFSLLGTTFGGDGRTTFALPDLRGRAAVGVGGSFVLGTKSGTETVTLNGSQMPAHNHFWRATSAAASTSEASGSLLATATVYTNSPPDPAAGNMNAAELTSVGGNQPHENRQPTLVLNWCIALQGIFPSQN